MEEFRDIPGTKEKIFQSVFIAVSKTLSNKAKKKFLEVGKISSILRL